MKYTQSKNKTLRKIHELLEEVKMEIEERRANEKVKEETHEKVAEEKVRRGQGQKEETYINIRP